MFSNQSYSSVVIYHIQAFLKSNTVFKTNSETIILHDHMMTNHTLESYFYILIIHSYGLVCIFTIYNQINISIIK